MTDVTSPLSWSWRVCVVCAVLVVGVPGTSARAQSIGLRADLADEVDVGEKVRVLRLDGSEIRGELSAIEPAFLAVDVDGQEVRIAAADVRDLAVKDGVYNGILIGLGAGLGAGLLTGYLGTSPEDGDLRGLAVMLAATAGAGVGIGLGAAFDAASAHYRTVHAVPATVRWSPLLGPGGTYGAAVAVAW